MSKALGDKMGTAFRADFSNIIIHESPFVEQYGARAVAQGNHIAFAPGMYNPDSLDGQALIGHELSHLVQQSKGEAKGQGLLQNQELEDSADRQGMMAAQGHSILDSEDGGTLKIPAMSPMTSVPMQASKKDRKTQANLRKANAAEALAHPEAADDTSTVLSPEWSALKTANRNPKASSTDVMSAYGGVANKQKATMTKEQRAAINSYIEDSRPINAMLRGQERNKTFDADLQDKVSKIDAWMPQTETNLKAYRAVSDVALNAMLRGSDSKKLRSAADEEGLVNHDKLADNIHKLVGTEFSDAAFGSTTLNPQFALNWGKNLPDRDRKTLGNKF